ncbi:MAG: hypothetical protein ACFE0P_09285 [Oceanicaulis sp.]
MALRSALFASALMPAFLLAACQESEPPTGAIDDDGAPAAAGESGEQAGSDLTTETARGGDAVSVAGDTERGPAVEAVARRFDLSEADTVILPTLYRSVADITSNALDIEASRGDQGYVTVSGSADPEAVLRQPREGLAFELTEDRVTEFLGQPVIVTLVARMNEDWEADGQRPALRAAWVEPNGDSSGWRTMGLTEDWQKAVFAYDQPTDTGGIHVLTLLPPDDQPVDIAALAIRAQGPDEPAYDGGDDGAMRAEDLPQLGASPRGSDMQEPRERQPEIGDDETGEDETGGDGG